MGLGKWVISLGFVSITPSPARPIYAYVSTYVRTYVFDNCDIAKNSDITIVYLDLIFLRSFEI